MIRRAARTVASVAAGAVLAIGLTLLVLAAPLIAPGVAALGPSVARAATPAPTEPPTGDTRSSGVGAGFVGQPLVAIALVAGIGLAAAGVTLAYVRLSDRGVRRADTGHDGGDRD